MLPPSLALAYPPRFLRTLVTTILLDGTTMAAVGAQLLRTESNPNDARFM